MNLIICCTPLQVLIAEKIVELYPDEKFYGLMITPIFNEKYKYYFKRMCNFCVDVHLIVTNNYSRYLIYYNVIKVKFLFKELYKIFVANINDSIVQSIVSKFNHARLYTFDDGTINIVQTNFGTSKCESSIKKCLRFVLRFNETIDSIKMKSVLHYTIYPDIPNIINNTRVIEFNKVNNTFLQDSQKINIMIGQPIFDNDEKNKIVTEKLINKFSVDFYFPHPREKYYVEGVKYIETPLIFEDYFLTYLLHKRCRVYTFYSSVTLNLLQFSNVEIVAIKLHGVGDKKSEELYRLFESKSIHLKYLDISTLENS